MADALSSGLTLSALAMWDTLERVACGHTVTSSLHTYSQPTQFTGPLYFGVVHPSELFNAWKQTLTPVTHSLTACIR
ncbi:hypothetical protein EB796_019402 [Bugula neritina]|uniref:Uncharacterized protein n=1 Tax=Bugula neritina TaxID=10212 RepID=A0A7J7J7X9_BUGNE|nr:hypothetical protein EB796_019402 [Bugula neritina]